MNARTPSNLCPTGSSLPDKMYMGRSPRTLRISLGSASRGNASTKDSIDLGLSEGKQSGSAMKASTSALSLLSQSNGVRAGSKDAFINFIGSSPADVD